MSAEMQRIVSLSCDAPKQKCRGLVAIISMDEMRSSMHAAIRFAGQILQAVSCTQRISDVGRLGMQPVMTPGVSSVLHDA